MSDDERSVPPEALMPVLRERVGTDDDSVAEGPDPALRRDDDPSNLPVDADRTPDQGPKRPTDPPF